VKRRMIRNRMVVVVDCGDGQTSLCCKPPRHVVFLVVGIVIGSR
jgi:hypothetical protein